MVLVNSVDIRIDRPDIEVWVLGGDLAPDLGSTVFNKINEMDAESLEMLGRYVLSRAAILVELKSANDHASSVQRVLTRAEEEQFNPEAMRKGGEDA